MYKFSRNKKLSKFVSSKIIDLKDKKLKDSMIEKKFEEGVDLFSSIENKQKNFESDTLFFASKIIFFRSNLLISLIFKKCFTLFIFQTYFSYYF